MFLDRILQYLKPCHRGNPLWVMLEPYFSKLTSNFVIFYWYLICFKILYQLPVFYPRRDTLGSAGSYKPILEVLLNTFNIQLWSLNIAKNLIKDLLIIFLFIFLDTATQMKLDMAVLMAIHSPLHRIKVWAMTYPQTMWTVRQPTNREVRRCWTLTSLVDIVSIASMEFCSLVFLFYSMNNPCFAYTLT